MNFFLQLLGNFSGGLNFPDVTEVLNNLIKAIFGWFQKIKRKGGYYKWIFFLQLLGNFSGAINFPDVTEVLNNLIKGIFGWS